MIKTGIRRGSIMGKGKEKKERKNTKPEQEVRHHSVWSNYRVAFAWMREIEGAAYFFFQGIEIALAVIQPFLAMALPGAVVYLLGSGWEPGKILLALAGYVLVLQGMHVARGYLERWCKKEQLFLRCKLGTQFFGASMEADYQSFESESGQKKLDAASWNIYYGDEKGIQAFLKALGNFLKNLIGLILYSAVIGSRSPGILILSLSVTGVASGIHAYAHKRAVKYDKTYEKVWGDYNKLGREVVASAHGKDIRMYHMWNWFAKELDRKSVV